MILLDTHIWIWWVQGDSQLSQAHAKLIEANEQSGLGVCTISLWEVAMATSKKRLELPCPLQRWLELAIAYPGVRLIELRPDIVTESVNLPGSFHGDPADRLIVAAARVLDCLLVTVDRRIHDYEHVKLA